MTETLDPYGRFMTLTAVLQSTGLSRTQVYRLMQRTDDPFPRPVKVGGRNYWPEAHVVAWKKRVVEGA